MSHTSNLDWNPPFVLHQLGDLRQATGPSEPTCPCLPSEGSGTVWVAPGEVGSGPDSLCLPALSSCTTAPRPGRRWTTTGRPQAAPTSCASWMFMRICITANAVSSLSWNGMPAHPPSASHLYPYGPHQLPPFFRGPLCSSDSSPGRAPQPLKGDGPGQLAPRALLHR